MGWRRDHLREAERKIDEGRLADVRKIAYERQSECGYAFSDLLAIKQSIDSYQKVLQQLEQMCTDNINHKTQHNAGELKAKLTSAIHHFDLIRQHTKDFLKEEGKLD